MPWNGRVRKNFLHVTIVVHLQVHAHIQAFMNSSFQAGCTSLALCPPRFSFTVCRMLAWRLLSTQNLRKSHWTQKLGTFNTRRLSCQTLIPEECGCIFFGTIRFQLPPNLLRQPLCRKALFTNYRAHTYANQQDGHAGAWRISRTPPQTFPL